MTELWHAARDYLSAGLTIIALTGKLPNTHPTIHPHGKDSAMSGVPEGPEDDELIERVFTHPDTTGVGIVLTHNMVVVDIDGLEGAQELADILGMDGPEMIEWAKHLDTPVAGTGRGLHIYYVTPRVQGTVKLGSKLDLKGLGGYVAAPPSIHPSGSVYEWGNGRKLVDLESGQRVHIDWLPEPIEQVLAAREKVLEDKRVEHETVYELQIVQEKPLILQMMPAKAALDIIAARVAREPVDSGNGSNILYWAGCVAAEEGYTLAEAYAALVPAVTKQWEQPMAERAARSTIRSAFKRIKGGK